jgi:hypothetical protein
VLAPDERHVRQNEVVDAQRLRGRRGKVKMSQLKGGEENDFSLASEVNSRSMRVTLLLIEEDRACFEFNPRLETPARLLHGIRYAHILACLNASEPTHVLSYLPDGTLHLLHRAGEHDLRTTGR